MAPSPVNPPPAPAALKLLAVVRRPEDLTEMSAAEKNRQHAASLSGALSAAVRLDVARSVRTQTCARERLARFALEPLP